MCLAEHIIRPLLHKTVLNKTELIYLNYFSKNKLYKMCSKISFSSPQTAGHVFGDRVSNKTSLLKDVTHQVNRSLH